MTSRDTWAQCAELLARRLAVHAHCDQHESIRSGIAQGCQPCADIAALRRFERHYSRVRGIPFHADATPAAAAADYDIPLPLEHPQASRI